MHGQASSHLQALIVSLLKKALMIFLFYSIYMCPWKGRYHIKKSTHIKKQFKIYIQLQKCQLSKIEQAIH